MKKKSFRQILSGSINHNVVLVIFAGVELKH